MKIGIIIAGMNMPGGIERVISIQANYWVRKAGYEVCLLTHLDKTCSSFYPLDEKVRNIYIGGLPSKILLDKIPGVYPLRVIRSRISQYKRVLTQEHPDVVLTMMHGSENYYMNLCSIGWPIIGVNHITLDLRKGVFEQNILKKLLVEISFKFQLHEFRKYSCIVALSNTDSNNLQKLGCQSVFIPNSASFPIIQTCNVRDKVVVMVGRLDYLKGQDRLLQIWKELADKYKEWKLMFVGDGPLKPNVEMIIRENGLQDRAIIISRTQNIQDYLLKASVFAFTSRSESFGMVLLEAFACGLPVISFDCENGPRDIIKNNVNGFLIADGDTQDFASKLQLLMDNKDIRDRFVQNGYKTLEDYSVEKVMSRWDLLLSKVCPM